MLQLNPLENPSKAQGIAVMQPLNNVAELGQAVRNARKAMKMNQQQFAKHVGVGRRFISELEQGKQTLEIGKVILAASAAGIALQFQENQISLL